MLYLSKKNGSTTSSEPYYYMLNLQGDVVHLVNTSGKAVASYSYDPYGAVISKSGSLADLNPSATVATTTTPKPASTT